MNLDPKVMTFEACSWMSEGHVVDLTGRRPGHKINTYDLQELV